MEINFEASHSPEVDTVISQNARCYKITTHDALHTSYERYHTAFVRYLNMMAECCYHLGWVFHCDQLAMCRKS